MKRRLGAKFAMLYLFDEDKDELWTCAGFGCDEDHQAVDRLELPGGDRDEDARELLNVFDVRSLAVDREGGNSCRVLQRS